MSKLNTYYIYIMTNKPRGTLYTGFTNDLKTRVNQHKDGTGSYFAKKYNLTKLVYFEEIMEASTAIEREKQLKAGSRQKKIELIEKNNSDWKDLSDNLQ
ncbi:MAG: hypothetical protein A3B31_03460 [Candidatus Komeilibacteria bacterium RIFCSPLOWO2_01_FULL_53_11]|uniref:GIY-YIG domain-containing protein n=1 Tax=Candidatus Komeilibacteria bacterium RIFCSPLOWO2_01_FULL_53_11 TaxID=1798552 RepID=A0A1G2BTE8_9BACT|nr:MAG: hypothetical protein A3B31_03460 [Candidatus Komeilibacteria bacterium RIFCSPLOWO2_01_FULL_53_11]